MRLTKYVGIDSLSKVSGTSLVSILLMLLLFGLACILISCSQKSPECPQHEPGILVVSANSEIWFIDEEGERLATRQLSDSFRYMRWSPDGCRLLLQKAGLSMVYDLRNGEAIGIPTLGLDADWSSDGQSVAFILDSGIYTQAIGTAERSLVWAATPDVSLGNIAWSPDGNSIAFTLSPEPALGREEQLQDIAILDVEAGTVHTLQSFSCPSPHNCPYVTSLDWSPDSQRIAFTMVEQDEGGRLCSIDVASGDLILLARTRYYSYSLAWSPDGCEIAYAQGKTSLFGLAQRELRIVDSQTGKDRPIYSEQCNDCVFWAIDWRVPQCDITADWH